MAVTDKAFTGSIPELYERYLVPLIFDSYAKDMAERVKRIGGHDVLETAAGTGVVTRALAAVLPNSTRLVVTDLNQAMLDVAKNRLSRPEKTEWKQADALALPFTDESFDIVVCQFGAMFFPDKRQGFKEARRVLKRSGKFLFSVWDGIADNEFADVITASLTDLFPGDPPRFLARKPHGYHNADVIRGELIAAGFEDVQFETVRHMSRSASSRGPAVGYCEGTPLRNEIIERDPTRLDQATLHAERALAERFGPGPIQGRIQATVFTASR